MRESDRTKRRYVERTVAAVVVLLAGGVTVSLLTETPTPAPLFADGFDGGQGGAPVPGPCEHPNIKPAGWGAVNKAWDFAWKAPSGLGGVPVYPNSVGHIVPVGASRGTYTVIGPFVPLLGQVVKVDWVAAQGSALIGYTQPRPADFMYFVVSPCAGDLRPPDANSSDGFLQTGCRRGGAEGSITFHTLSNPSNFQSCQVIAGQTYYMTVIAATPADGLDAGESTCAPVGSTASGCDVNAAHRLVQ